MSEGHMTAICRFGLLAPLAAVSLAGCGINSVPTAEEQVNASWGDLQADYQRRADLIPNLVATVKGYAQQEKTVLTQVIIPLQRLQEAYPDLKSNQNFLALQDQLEGTENRIEVARRDYNEEVRSYNTRIRTFPDAIGAKIFYGAKPKVPFEAAAAAQEAPTVNFNTNTAG